MPDYSKYAEQAAKMEKPNYRYWTPKTGEFIVGEVVDKAVIEQTKFGAQAVLEIKDEEGVIWKRSHTKSITDELSRKKVKRGDVIILKYFDAVKTRGGKAFKNFKIEVVERSPESDGDFKDDIPF